MTGRVERRLQELGITLPGAPAPVANYVPYVVHGDLVFVSGQITFVDGKVAHTGRVGGSLTIEQGQAAARVCALNVLAQLHAACSGDLDRVVRCLRVGGFVNSAPDFTQQPQVINGASDLFVEVLGDIGRHARFAVGAGNLPADSAVEVEAIFAIRSA